MAETLAYIGERFNPLIVDSKMVKPEHLEVCYLGLYNKRMSYLDRSGSIQMDLHDPENHDMLLTEIIFALECVRHGVEVPEQFAFECMQERVKSQYEDQNQN